MSELTAFPVYFGGQMFDEWTADTLKINYSDRPFVFAVPGENGGFTAESTRYPLLAAEINECPYGLKRAYFDAYTAISVAIAELTGRGDDVSCLPEHLSSPFSPLVAAELLRVLLDDWGLRWEQALDITARCEFRPAVSPFRFTVRDVSTVQPRTAQLLNVLRGALGKDPAVDACMERMLSRLIVHDCASERYRSPIGACPTGSTVQLRFRDDSGLVQQAMLILDGDGYHHIQAMSGDLSCTCQLPTDPIALRYRFRLTLLGGSEYYLGDVFGKQSGRVTRDDGTGFRLTVYQNGFDTPAWFRQSVMYQIFPDRFARDGSDTAEKGIAYHRALGQRADASAWDQPVKWQPGEGETGYMPNDFYGGTLRGIMEKLPYLHDLGVSVLYLNPIVEACSNHRYDTADYRRPDPILGSMEDFRELTRQAAKLGIRVILDGVYSHTGADSIYFNRYGHYDSQGACQSKDSPYYGWYDFSEYPDKYRSWWGFDSLPEVEEENPAWQEFVITGQDSVIRTWLREGASGWRLDVADELPDDVLELIRTAVKEESPDHVLLGEVWEDAIEKESYGTRRTYALGRALDTVMNYPLRNAVLAFLSGEGTAEELADFLLSQRLHYPKPMYYALMNLLSSHDIPRIRTMLAIAPEKMPGDRAAQAARTVSDAEDARGARLQKLAAALCFALPGVPSVYYGDETGMNGFTDPFNRAPFTTGNHPLVDWYAALAALRSRIPALSTGAMAVFAAGKDTAAVLRTVTDGTDVFGLPAENGVCLLAVNRSGETARVSVDLLERGRGLTEVELAALRTARLSEAVPLLGEGACTVQSGRASLTLPPVSACIFALK